MTEGFKSIPPEVVNDGGIQGVIPYTLEWAHDFLSNYGLPKDWQPDDEGYTWYFAPNIWEETGLWLGTNIASNDSMSFLIAKAPSKKRLEIAVIEWKYYGGGETHKVWWDKTLTIHEAGEALSIMEDRIEAQKDLFDEQFDDLRY